MLIKVNKTQNDNKYEVETLDSENIELQTKTATENGDVEPDEGYYGLSKVSVNVSTDISSLYESNPGMIRLTSDADGYPDTPEFCDFGQPGTLPAGTYIVADGYFIDSHYDLPTLIAEYFTSGVTCTHDNYYNRYKIIVESEYTVVDGNPFYGGTLFIGAVNQIV